MRSSIYICIHSYLNVIFEIKALGAVEGNVLVAMCSVASEAFDHNIKYPSTELMHKLKVLGVWGGESKSLIYRHPCLGLFYKHLFKAQILFSSMYVCIHI